MLPIFVLLTHGISTIGASCGSGGGGGTKGPCLPVPVKTNHKKYGRNLRCLIFHVSCPPPLLWSSWIRCCGAPCPMPWPNPYSTPYPTPCAALHPSPYPAPCPGPYPSPSQLCTLPHTRSIQCSNAYSVPRSIPYSILHPISRSMSLSIPASYSAHSAFPYLVPLWEYNRSHYKRSSSWLHGLSYTLSPWLLVCLFVRPAFRTCMEYSWVLGPCCVSPQWYSSWSYSIDILYRSSTPQLVLLNTILN